MDKLNWLWKTGAELYRTKWIRDWGNEPSETLEQLLGKLSAKDIKLGFSECIKQAQNGKEWPPVPITFISLCKNSGIDIDGSFDRFIKKEPAADLSEKITRSEIGFNCRSMADDKARKLWAQYYKVNYQKMKEGKLQSCEAKLLTEHVTTKPTDTMRDNFKPSTKQSAELIERLNKIRNT